MGAGRNGTFVIITKVHTASDRASFEHASSLVSRPFFLQEPPKAGHGRCRRSGTSVDATIGPRSYGLLWKLSETRVYFQQEKADNTADQTHSGTCDGIARTRPRVRQGLAPPQKTGGCGSGIVGSVRARAAHLRHSLRHRSRRASSGLWLTSTSSFRSRIGAVRWPLPPTGRAVLPIFSKRKCGWRGRWRSSTSSS